MIASGRTASASSGMISGYRVGHGEDQRISRHLLDHVGREHVAGRQAEKDVGILDDLVQLSRIRLHGIARLVVIHALGAAGIDHALCIGHDDMIVPQPKADDEIETRKRRGAGAGANQLDVRDVLLHQLQPVEDRRRCDDRGAVLVIVKDRNLHSGAQLLLDVEAFRRLDVLQVDAAEGRLHPGDRLDQRVRIFLGEFDIEYVDSGELLEQARLAFHDRLARQRADIAETKHGGAVGDDGHEVAARRQLIGLQRVLGDDQARLRHAG